MIPKLVFFAHTVLKLMVSLKKGQDIHNLTNINLFSHSRIGPIRSFLAGHGLRCDSETSWLLDVRTLTNLTDTFILSQKTKRSDLEAEWAGQAKLLLEDLASV